MLNDIKEIVLNPLLTEEYKMALILETLSKDDNVICHLLILLNKERQYKKELISELNLNLSRSLVYLENPKIIKKDFILSEIKKFYLDFQDKIKCSFTIKGLP